MEATARFNSIESNYFFDDPLAALILAQRALMVAAIFAFCAALMVFRLGEALAAAGAGLLADWPCSSAFFLAQRAFKAAEILARPAAESSPFFLGGGAGGPKSACIWFSRDAICSLIWAAFLSWSAVKSAIVFIAED